jgi:hypothetical protein
MELLPYNHNFCQITSHTEHMPQLIWYYWLCICIIYVMFISYAIKCFTNQFDILAYVIVFIVQELFL